MIKIQKITVCQTVRQLQRETKDKRSSCYEGLVKMK